jgi:BirA family biotin operon repressor/biotin-[acetyl-CoA-carboxylase] ligase
MDKKIKLSAIEIKKRLATPDIITLDVLESVSSTNDYFKGKPLSSEFEFCFAESQTQGRGRLGRTWHSPSGVNLIFSCRWSLPESLNHLEGLSSCVSLSLLSALKYLNIPDLMCKWPNDLFYQDKKLAGILIELYSHEGQIREAVIGIGLNANMINKVNTLEKPWTSLQQILGAPQDRNILAVKIIQSLLSYLRRFADNGWKDFIKEWAEYDYLKGREVSIPIDHQERVSGIAIGIDISGGLLIETADNKIMTCKSGEVWGCE